VHHHPLPGFELLLQTRTSRPLLTDEGFRRECP
jgi:hypothetical protein